MRQLEHVLVRKHTRHQGVHVSREHAGHIRDRLALTQPDLVGREIQGIAAHVAHGHIERDARAQAGLLEDHAQYLALQQRRIAPVEILLLQAYGQVEQVLYLCRREIRDSEKILHGGHLRSVYRQAQVLPRLMHHGFQVTNV